jgi:hypothetical protein
LFADGLVQSIRDPDIGSFSWLAVVVLIVVLMTLGLRKWLRRRRVAPESGTGS